MARIVISSAGTVGDFVPFVALGKRLRARGHRVLMAINPAMSPLAEKAGLENVPCGRVFGALEARQRAMVFDHWVQPTDEEIRKQWRYLDIDQSYRDLASSCRDADLLIASTLQAAAPMVHEQSGIPWISVSLLPMEFADSEDPLAAPMLPMWHEMLANLNRIRGELGFPPLTPARWLDYPYSERLLLLASSPNFSQPVLNEFPQLRVTGFWFDDTPLDWAPDGALVRFLYEEPRPLVLTFSSLPIKDVAQVAALHAEAAAQLKRRLLIQNGWARMDAGQDLPETVCFAGFIPHAWLFDRAGAVIHHGGIGTTAQALRSGCPMLVEPYGNDQFFNARRVMALGVGAAMHPHKLSATGLTRVLAEKVLTAKVQQRALDLSGKLRSEDGLTTACDLIEQQLGTTSI